MRALAFLLLLPALAQAAEVRGVQWRVFATLNPGEVRNFAQQAATETQDAIPYSIGEGCYIAVGTGHLAAKEPPGERSSYLVLQGFTSFMAGAPTTFSPPFVLDYGPYNLTLINNSTIVQVMIGTVTGWEVCDVPKRGDVWGAIKAAP